MTCLRPPHRSRRTVKRTSPSAMNSRIPYAISFSEKSSGGSLAFAFPVPQRDVRKLPLQTGSGHSADASADFHQGSNCFADNFAAGLHSFPFIASAERLVEKAHTIEHSVNHSFSRKDPGRKWILRRNSAFRTNRMDPRSAGFLTFARRTSRHFAFYSAGNCALPSRHTAVRFHGCSGLQRCGSSL